MVHWSSNGNTIYSFDQPWNYCERLHINLINLLHYSKYHLIYNIMINLESPKLARVPLDTVLQLQLLLIHLLQISF